MGVAQPAERFHSTTASEPGVERHLQAFLLCWMVTVVVARQRHLDRGMQFAPFAGFQQITEGRLPSALQRSVPA